MKIHIELVDKCLNKAYGTTQLIDKDNVRIEISKDKNKERAEFFVTTLHELHHAWMFIVKGNGVNISEHNEHNIIYSTQNYVVQSLAVMASKKNKRKKK